MSATRRRGNSEGSNPVQRADGRWQVHIRHTDEDGSSRRHTVYGSTAKEARDKAAEVGSPACLPARQGSQDHPGWVYERVDQFGPGGVGSESDHEESVQHDGARAHDRSRTGARPLDKLRPSHIDAWKVELKDRGWLSSRSAPRTRWGIVAPGISTALGARPRSVIAPRAGGVAALFNR